MKTYIFAAFVLFVAVGCGEVTVSSNESPITVIDESKPKTTTIEVVVEEGAFNTFLEGYSIILRSTVDGREAHVMEPTVDRHYAYTFTVDSVVTDKQSFGVFMTHPDVAGEKAITQLVNISINEVVICQSGRLGKTTSFPVIDTGCDLNKVTAEPKPENPPVVNPPAVKPPVVNPPHVDPGTVTQVATYGKLVFIMEAWGSSAYPSVVQDITKAKDQLSWGTVDIGHLNDPTWRAAILEWKALIPNVQVHCYINYQEFFDSNSARVWQQMLRDEIVNLYPEYQLNDMNGNGISVWPGMTMNNLLSSSPVASNGLTFHQWYVKKLVEKMQLPDHDEVCDGFHLDNQNYITSWIPEWLGPVDADFTDYWDFDVKWQDGLEMIIDGLRAAFPDKEISCRSKSHRFLEKCDRVIFEQTLTGPPNTDIPGGWLGRIHQARIIQKYTSHMVLHYDYSAWWLESDWQDKLDQYVETTMSACMTNDFECAFDLSGPDAHDFIYQPHMGVQCGAPISDRVDAFATVHSVPGQTFVSNNSTLGALPVQRGDVAVFWRDIFGGDFNHSIMTGIPNEQRWNAGLFAAIYNGTSLNLGLTGGGELMIEDLLVVRPTDPASTGYDYRNFEGCETFVNMTTTFNPSTYAMEGVTLQAETRDGRTLIIEPGRACIVTYVEGDVQTTCAITE